MKNIKTSPKEIHLLNNNFKQRSEELDMIRRKLKEGHRPKKTYKLSGVQVYPYSGNKYESSEEKLYLQLKKKVSEKNQEIEINQKTEPKIDLNQEDYYE